MVRTNHKKQTFFVIEWGDLPEPYRTMIVERGQNVVNGCYIKHYSEFRPRDLAKGGAFVEGLIEGWYEEGKHDYKGDISLADFIEDNGLELDLWIAKQGFDLKGVDDILIHVWW